MWHRFTSWCGTIVPLLPVVSAALCLMSCLWLQVFSVLWVLTSFVFVSGSNSWVILPSRLCLLYSTNLWEPLELEPYFFAHCDHRHIWGLTRGISSFRASPATFTVVCNSLKTLRCKCFSDSFWSMIQYLTDVCECNGAEQSTVTKESIGSEMVVL